MDLSIIIPARNEMFLTHTVDDLLKNIWGKTEIIVVCDGNWPLAPMLDNPKVTLVYHSQPIGQRASTNKAVKLSRAKYVMKVDAHCAFDEGFDLKMMAEMQDDWTMVPVMRNLHVFNWVCEAGHRRYQSPSGPCQVKDCGKPTTMEIVWNPKKNPLSTSYCFDPEPHFRYFQEFKERPEYKRNKSDLTETMSLQGSCWMLTRDKYWELDVCDEELGSWGSQGIEVAVKTWLSGGRVVCNHKTWYAHMFRTQGKDFGFPYPISGRQTEHAKKTVRDLFFNNKWPKQKYPLSWLLEKFWPVHKWTEEDLSSLKKREVGMSFKSDHTVITINAVDTKSFEEQIRKNPEAIRRITMKPELKKGIVYYTDNHCKENILEICRKQIKNCVNGNEIISVSLDKPIDFGKNIVLQLKRSYLTMFKQILAGIEASTADIIFLVEHDVLYHPSHFSFNPPRNNIFYYDENRWFVDYETGKALFYNAMSTSMLCAYRSLLLEHYKKRVERVEKEGFSYRLGFEPGNHPFPRGVDYYGREAYFSEFPSIDIRHGKNLTPSRWSQDEFRNKKNLYAWKESEEVPGWGMVQGRFKEILNWIGNG